jgi:Phosphotransferase enzyme family
MRNEENEPYRLVIVFEEVSKFLLVCGTEGRVSLPEVTIPKWQRVAESLTARVKESWNLDAICLFDPVWEYKPTLDVRCNYRVLESCDALWEPRKNYALFETASVSRESFISPEDSRVVECSLRLLNEYNSGATPGPFAQSGWLGRLRAWVQQQIGTQGLMLADTQRHFNSSPFFNLMRFETVGDSAVWFKAVGEPNLREYPITAGLAQDYPRYFPKLLGIHPEWHGWLTAEANLPLLQDTDDIENWKSAVETLADLQVELVDREKYLLNLGCTDWRVDQITRRIDPFLTALEEIMKLQPKTPPAILSKCELDELGGTLKAACQRLQVLGIPNTYIHGDFGPQNILSSRTQCLFIDLAESGVGHPFLTFQYLLDCLHRSHPELDATHSDLRRAYGTQWRSFATDEEIADAFKLAPLVTLLWHAMSCSGWQQSRGNLDGDAAKYLRSLVRSMKARASELEYASVA